MNFIIRKAFQTALRFYFPGLSCVWRKCQDPGMKIIISVNSKNHETFYMRNLTKEIFYSKPKYDFIFTN